MANPDEPLSERIAHAALRAFKYLPDKCKPRIHPDGRREWTTLAAVVVVSGDDDESVHCVSLATGTKCIPSRVLPQCQGKVLHDSHAEVLALRGFNRFLLDQMMERIIGPDSPSFYIKPSSTSSQDSDHGWREPKWMLREGLSVHLFVTEAPCGDASMELLMESQSNKSPWELHKSNTDTSTVSLPGRGYFSELGVVRRKPARADADPSMSKSCSDKLALKQFTGLLSFPTDLLVEHTPNVFLKSLVVYADQYNETGYERAFSTNGRLSAAAHHMRPFEVDVLPSSFPKFEFARSTNTTKPSDISALFIPQRYAPPHEQALRNGVKQGFAQSTDRRGKASIISRAHMWEFGDLMAGAHDCDAYFDPGAKTYAQIKGVEARAARRERKANALNVLQNWIPNSGDEDWECPKRHTL